MALENQPVNGNGQVAPAGPPEPAVSPPAVSTPPEPVSFSQAYEAANTAVPAATPSPAVPGQAAPATSAVPAAGSAPADYLRQQLTARGFDTSSFASDDEVFNGIIHALPQIQALPQLQELAQHGQTYLQHAAEFETWRQQKAAAATQTQAATAAEKPKWGPPEQWNPQYDRFVEVDPATGRWKAIAPELAPYAEKRNKIEEWRASTAERLLADPMATLNEAGLEQLLADRDKKLLETWQRQQDEAAARAQSQDFFRQNQQHLFVHDATGNPVIDPRTQQWVPSPTGQAMFFYMDQAKKLGIQRDSDMQNYALQQMEFDHLRATAQQAPPPAAPATPDTNGPRDAQGRFLPKPAQAPQGLPAAGQAPAAPLTPEQRNQAQKTAFLNRQALGGAGHMPNRDATIASAAAGGFAQNEELNNSFMELAKESMQQRGLLPMTG